MADRYLREVQIIHLLRVDLARLGLTQRKWARKHRIPEQIVSDFLNGRRGPNEAILEALGLDPQPAWRMAMSRKADPVPTPERLDAEKASNRQRLAELRRTTKTKPKKSN